MSDLNEIFRKRKELGWTQNKLAEEAGVSLSWVAKAEKYPENCKISYFMVRKVLNVLDARLIANKMKTLASQTVEKP